MHMPFCWLTVMRRLKLDSVKVYPHTKYIYCKCITPWSVFFNTGSRIGQIVHTRHRIECSALNNDLYRRNLNQNPICECGEIETATHYIFQCLSFNECRRQYFSDLLPHRTLERFTLWHSRLNSSRKRGSIK